VGPEHWSFNSKRELTMSSGLGGRKSLCFKAALVT
jgi:hypothetical protein